MIDFIRRLPRPRMNVGWFVPEPVWNFEKALASVWIRCFQLVPYLKAEGVDAAVNDENRRHDVAVFLRLPDDEALRRARALKARGTRIVFDLCVNYFDETEVPGTGLAVTKAHVDGCRRMMDVADVVTTASAYIADRASEHHAHVVYLPDSIDRSHFRCAKNETDFDRVALRAIWAGVAPKAVELQPILPLLEERGIGLTIIAERPPALRVASARGERDFPYAFVQWTHRAFPRDVLGGEISLGYRPLSNPYNHGHSHFKVGVFLNAGIPAVTSPVPSYREILDRHECGVVCHTPGEWAAALDRVCTDRTTLKCWSRETRVAMEPYSTERVARRYVDLFESLQ
jgi:hypothetical protein